MHPMARLVAILCLLGGANSASSSTLSLPNTQAGRVLASWLDALNSGDSASIESFDKTHVPWLSLDRAMDLRARTGGYELLSIESSDDLWIIFRAKEKASQREVIGKLVLDSGNPAVVSALGLQVASPDAEVEEITLDAVARDRVIENAAKLVDEFYVFPDLARRMSAALRMRRKRRDYRAITDGDVLATRLTDDLRAVSHDRHILVRFSPGWVVPPDEPGRRPDTGPILRSHLAASNCGFAKAEHLPPNIGYLKVDEFGEAEICGPTAIAAMNFLAGSDALIIDLRDNHGGAPGMVALICSYLFGEPTHLDDIFDREQNTTQQSWTLPYIPGKGFTGKPVFVLISRKTFSAAEEFSYDLKSLKRATLVGETSGGGAHTVAPHRLDDHFFIEVPFGRFVNPITKTDWEGTGVEPDIEVPAADALAEALKRARSAVPSADAAH